MSLHIDENGAVTLGKERHQLCLEAAWELEELGYLLPTLPTNTEAESAMTCYAIRGISSRCVTLANALMEALIDEVKKTSDIAREVRVLP